jgi:hypothetical protein
VTTGGTPPPLCTIRPGHRHPDHRKTPARPGPHPPPSGRDPVFITPRQQREALHDFSFEDATQVQVNDAGERLVTNGPFAESREYLGGYQVIDVPDLDAALDWAARCPGAKYGRVEVRPLAEF